MLDCEVTGSLCSRGWGLAPSCCSFQFVTCLELCMLAVASRNPGLPGGSINRVGLFPGFHKPRDWAVQRPVVFWHVWRFLSWLILPRTNPKATQAFPWSHEINERSSLDQSVRALEPGGIHRLWMGGEEMHDWRFCTWVSCGQSELIIPKLGNHWPGEPWPPFFQAHLVVCSGIYCICHLRVVQSPPLQLLALKFCKWKAAIY